jgi:hypothetical protein
VGELIDMRFSRTVLLSALALVSGCGGCESCLTPQVVVDEAGPATTSVRPSSPADAATDAREADSGRDAAPAATAEPVLLRDAGVPLLRPKAPMALGAYQVCGVYDGPLCEKPCPKGACRQECDGVECLLTCEKGYCSQLCGAAGKCKMTCAGGHCIQACTKANDCIKECSGGGCE